MRSEDRNEDTKILPGCESLRCPAGRSFAPGDQHFSGGCPPASGLRENINVFTVLFRKNINVFTVLFRKNINVITVLFRYQYWLFAVSR
jgi:hypothetical protein